MTMFHGDKQTTPEERLIYAILLQAYRDLFISVKEPNGPDNLNRDQAISFFTNRSGALAAHRNHLCSLIGWDG